MKSTVVRLVLIILGSVSSSGCREPKVLSYPHSFLGEIRTSAEWREISFAPRRIKRAEFLNVRLAPGGKTICVDAGGDGETHPCSAEAVERIKELRAEDRKNGAVESFDRRRRIVREQPVLNVEIELVTDSGEARSFADGAAASNADGAAFKNKRCDLSIVDRERARNGENANRAFFPPEAMDAKTKACEESAAEPFVKMRVRSPDNLKIESVRIGTYEDVMR